MRSFLIPKPLSAAPPIEVGGQAVIDGVLMRTRAGYAVAVRRPDGSILGRQVPFETLGRTRPLLRLPVVRGAVALFEMMAVGLRALQWSAEASSGGRGEALPRSSTAAAREAGLWALLLASFAAAGLIIVAVPSLMASAVGWLFLDSWAQARGTLGFSEENHPFLFNLLSGTFRAALAVGYVWAIGRTPDVRRVFECHGAEHKVVLAYEQGAAQISVEAAQERDTLHPRCGTTFIAIVAFVSILVFAAAAHLVSTRSGAIVGLSAPGRKLAMMGLQLAFLPVVAGTAFEVMKFCARNAANPVCRLVLWPGYLFQRMTTRQPSDEQVEVAIVALEAALAIRQGQRRSLEFIVEDGVARECSPAESPRMAPRPLNPGPQMP